MVGGGGGHDVVTVVTVAAALVIRLGPNTRADVQQSSFIVFLSYILCVFVSYITSCRSTDGRVGIWQKSSDIGNKRRTSREKKTLSLPL